MGVTSTGKSTLLNAILGGDILPKGVRPTSNTLVVCRRGSTLRCAVVFENGNTKEIKGCDIKERLSEYADEKTNPENVLGVREIEVESPDFAFGDSIELVDTPGLDAYGLERHEALTLQVLLPSVDSVLFVTTTKPASDKKIAMYLAQVKSSGKQFVVIQNKADSVKPELGHGGLVRMEIAEVLIQRKNRLKRLFKEWLGSENAVPIIQLSALRAMRSQKNDTGLLALIDSVSKFLQEIGPQIAYNRCQTIHHWLSQLIERESTSSLAERDEVLEKELTDIESTKKHLKKVRDRSISIFQKACMDHFKEGNELRKKLSSIRSNQISHTEELLEELIEWNKCRDFVTEPFRDYQLAYSTIASKLGVEARAKQLRFPSTPSVGSSSRLFEEKEIIREVKKKGFFNGLWRLLGVGGKEKRVEHVTRVIKEELLRYSEEVMRRKKKWVQDSEHIVIEEITLLHNSLVDELLERQIIVTDKRDAALSVQMKIEAARSLEPIRDSLCELLESSPEQKEQDWAGEYSPEEVDLTSKNVSSLLKDLLVVSNLISERRFPAARDVILSRVDACSKGESHRILVTGFSVDSLKKFTQRFMPEIPEREIAPGALHNHEGLSDFGATDILLLSEGDYNFDDEKIESPSVLFLLLDAAKPGSTRSVLQRSILPGIIQQHKNVVLCIESYAEIRNSGIETEVEATNEILKIMDDLDCKVIGCLVNDENIYHTFLLDYILRNGKEIVSLQDEQDAIKAVASGENDIGNAGHAGQFLRKWREFNHS